MSTHSPPEVPEPPSPTTTWVCPGTYRDPGSKVRVGESEAQQGYVYVCTHMCLGGHVYTCVHAHLSYMHVYMFMSECMCMCVSADVCISESMHVCVRTCVSVHVYSCVYTHMCACMCTRSSLVLLGCLPLTNEH